MRPEDIRRYRALLKRFPEEMREEVETSFYHALQHTGPEVLLDIIRYARMNLRDRKGIDVAMILDYNWKETLDFALYIREQGSWHYEYPKSHDSRMEEMFWHMESFQDTDEEEELEFDNIRNLEEMGYNESDIQVLLEWRRLWSIRLDP